MENVSGMYVKRSYFPKVSFRVVVFGRSSLNCLRKTFRTHRRDAGKADLKECLNCGHTNKGPAQSGLAPHFVGSVRFHHSNVRFTLQASILTPATMNRRQNAPSEFQVHPAQTHRSHHPKPGDPISAEFIVVCPVLTYDVCQEST